MPTSSSFPLTQTVVQLWLDLYRVLWPLIGWEKADVSLIPIGQARQANILRLGSCFLPSQKFASH
jgi:hypothetical protein